MSTERIKPMIILPPKAVSKADIAELNANGIVTIVAKDPSAVRFCEPPPEGYTAAEVAAIGLARILLKPENREKSSSGHHCAALYVDLLLKGTPLREIPPAPVKSVQRD